MSWSIILRSLVMWVLCPVSPFIWMSLWGKNDRDALLQRHLILTAVLWITLGIVFGLLGGQWIEKMRAFY